jgi:hypothetical protein
MQVNRVSLAIQDAITQAVAQERERYWIHRKPAEVHGVSSCEPQYKTSQCLNLAHWHKFNPLDEDFLAVLAPTGGRDET